MNDISVINDDSDYSYADVPEREKFFWQYAEHELWKEKSFKKSFAFKKNSTSPENYVLNILSPSVRSTTSSYVP